MARVWLAVVGFVAWSWPATVEAGGKLDSARGQVRGGGGSASSSPSRARTSPPPATYRTTYRATYRYPAYRSGAASHGSRPPTTRDYDQEPRSPLPSRTLASWDDHPYAYGNRYYVRRVAANHPNERDLFAGTAHVEGGYVMGGVWKMGGGLALRAWRLGIDSDIHYLVEPRARDSLYLGTTNVTFALVMRPPFVWRIGPGVNYMLDGRIPGRGTREYAAGVNASTTMDIFPAKPIVLSGRFDYGTIWKAHTLQVRGTVGYIVKRWELYAGYELERVGNVPLGGPMLGARAWF